MTSRSLAGILCVACAAALFAEETPVAVSEAYKASLDTVEYGFRSVTSQDEAVEIYGFKGATIIAKNLVSGATETIVTDVPEAGFLSWTPSAGGVWELVNKQDGTATFTVRYSLFDDGEQGSGTATDPLKIVDNAEVKDLIAEEKLSDGSFFAFVGGCADMAGLLLPGGYSVSELDGGTYMIETSSDGKVYASSSRDSMLYTDGSGPNRNMKIRETRVLAYTGDNWLGAADAASSLTLLSPLDVSTITAYAGTGTVPFTPAEKGQWTVSLETEDYTYTSLINVFGIGMAITIR